MLSTDPVATTLGSDTNGTDAVLSIRYPTLKRWAIVISSASQTIKTSQAFCTRQSLHVTSHPSLP